MRPAREIPTGDMGVSESVRPPPVPRHLRHSIEDPLTHETVMWDRDDAKDAQSLSVTPLSPPSSFPKTNTTQHRPNPLHPHLHHNPKQIPSGRDLRRALPGRCPPDHRTCRQDRLLHVDSADLHFSPPSSSSQTPSSGTMPSGAPQAKAPSPMGRRTRDSAGATQQREIVVVGIRRIFV
jgi:hypothetical protein